MEKPKKKTLLLIGLVVVTAVLVFLNFWLQKKQEASQGEEVTVRIDDSQERDPGAEEVDGTTPLVVASGLGGDNPVHITDPAAVVAASRLPLSPLRTVKGWHWSLCDGADGLYFYADPAWEGVVNCVVDAYDPALSVYGADGNAVQERMLKYVRDGLLIGREVSPREEAGVSVVEVTFSEGEQPNTTHMPAGVRRTVYLLHVDGRTYEVVYTLYPGQEDRSDVARDYVSGLIAS